MISEAIERPHISASQLESYCRCPEAYRRRYLEREVIPPGIAILKGKGFHAGAETNMRQKIDSHIDLPASDIVDAAVAALDAESHGGYSLTPEESGRGASVVLGEARDSLVRLADVHAEKQAPDYQPLLVEQAVRIALPGSRDLLGIIDLADDQGRVVDFKTSGRSKRQDDADSSVQLSVYAAAHKARLGEAPSEVRLDVVVDGKKGATRQVLISARDDRDLAALAARITAVSAGIDAGSFPPATPGAWWCHQKWCGYFSTCPYVNGERKALAESE